jgi:hypothetical protein
MGNVSQRPVDHAIAIKIPVFGITHLTQTKVLAIGIDCLYTPIAFLCDQRVKALKFFVINNP